MAHSLSACLRCKIATHDKPYLAAAKGTWDVMQGVSAVLDDNLLGSRLCQRFASHRMC